MTQFAIALHRLLKSGLGEPARVIARSLVETVEVAVIATFDHNFAAELFAAIDGKESTRFWSQCIGYGKATRRVDEIVALLDIERETLEYWSATRRHLKHVLSGSVHTSARAAFWGGLTTSLQQPGKLMFTPLGWHALGAPQLLYIASEELHRFLTTILRLLMLDKPPELFSSAKATYERFRPVFIELLTLQTTLDRHAKAAENLRTSPHKLKPKYNRTA